jgi:nucleotide-binding universal stress UspA family protein
MPTILVPTDGSTAAERAIDHAIAIVDRLGGSVHGVYAVHLQPAADYELGVGAPTIREAEEKRGEAALNTVKRRCEAADVPVETHRREGRPAAVITAAAREVDADLIAMGTHGRGGLSGPLLGSSTVAVLREAPTPVLAVPRGAEPPAGGYGTLLVATDGSEAAREAEATAIEWAQAHDAAVSGLYVVELAFSDASEVEDALEVDGQRVLADLDERARAAGLEVETAVESGVPHQVITDRAEGVDADLIVLGAHGRGGFERAFLGSVSERTVRTASRPVLVV